MTGDYEIIQGSALEVLRRMPDESVQCCICSPPYYGLRSYGTEPQVWGNHNGCDHVWGDEQFKATNNNPSKKSTLTTNNGKGPLPGDKYESSNGLTASLGNFCLSCNAWRGELGLEPTFSLYLDHLIEIFREVRRVLKPDGTAWVNLGDSFASSWPCNRRSVVGQGSLDNGKREARPERLSGLREKSLMNIPARFAIAMTDELGWINRNHIIWHKPACMPSSAKDRFTVDFESIFFFSKEPRYKFNQQYESYSRIWDESNYGDNNAWKLGKAEGLVLGRKEMPNSGLSNCLPNEQGRNKRTVWTVNFEPSGDEHYAAYPTKLIEPMILAGSDDGDTVLDPFSGTGTTGLVALRNRRRYIGIELNPEYIKISRRRLREVQVNLFP